MTQRSWHKSRFDQQEQEPLGPLANLVDIMLVFACGLIAALVASGGGLPEQLGKQGQQIEKGKELPNLPRGIGQTGAGYEAVGQVYRDNKTGKLILIGEPNDSNR